MENPATCGEHCDRCRILLYLESLNVTSGDCHMWKTIKNGELVVDRIVYLCGKL